MLASGTEIGRYRIETLLGSGGMGEVYRAYDSLLRRRVALKVLRPDLPDAAARLLREGRAAAALSHPNAVAVFDVGESAGLTFIAMELVEGKPMREYIGDAMVPMPDRVRWLVDLAHALGAAHQKGFVHRDIKPENVMICSDGTLKVLDFGIAKQAGVEGAAPVSIAHSGPASYRTAEGRITGTPRYMSPEQLRGDPLDARTDEYSWGVVAYELLAGVHPLALTDGSRPPEMLNQRVRHMPFEIAAVVARAMAPAAELRFATMDELAATLAPFVAGPAASSASGTLMRGVTGGVSHVAATVDASAATGGAGGLQQPIRARVHDVAGPWLWRVLSPAVAIALLLLTARLRLIHGSVAFNAAIAIAFLLAVVFAWFRPLLELRREPRLASLSTVGNTLHIAGAGSWSQALRPAGASIAPSAQGASLVVARPRVLDPPVRVELASVAEGQALLAACGIASSPFGLIRWSLGRGLFDWACIAIAVCWRLAWLLTGLLASLELRTLGALVLVGATALSIAAIVLKVLQPGPGPHVLLSERGIDVKGHVMRFTAGRWTYTPTLSLPLNVILGVRAGSGGMEIDIANGEKAVMRVVPVRWSNRGLTLDEIDLVASHIEAAASRARGRSFVALPTNATVQSGYGATR